MRRPRRTHRFAALAIGWGLAVAVGGVLDAHRLDEYLQATQIGIARDTVTVGIFLTPGVLVAAGVIKEIDVDADGRISNAEMDVYARRVVAGFRLTQDARALTLRITAAQPVESAALLDGEGTMSITTIATLPSAAVGPHELVLENHFEPNYGVYLANAMLPEDGTTVISRQDRSSDQTRIAITYEVVRAPQWSKAAWLALAGVCLGVGLVFWRRLSRPASIGSRR